MAELPLLTHPLTALRVDRGWTLDQLAHLISANAVGYMAANRQKVYRWERGVVPERAAQAALAAVLHLPPWIIDTQPWPKWLPSVEQGEPVHASWTAGNARAVLANVVQSAVMDRRAFLSATSGTLLGLAAGWSTATPADLEQLGQARVTPDVIDHLQQRVEDLWYLDDAIGGGGCLDAADADLRMVHHLIGSRAYTADIGTQLYRVAASLARFCGWAAFDDGRAAAAQRFWHAGLRAAAAAGDVDQGVYIMSNIGLAAAYAGDGRSAVAVLQRARARVNPDHRVVLAMLDCWTARGHAVAGNPTAAAATLAEADRLWSRRVEGADPSFVYWMPLPSTTAEAATALLQDHAYGTVERSLRASLDARVPAGSRDRGLYLGRLAETALRAGRLDEGVAIAHEAIDETSGVESGRTRRIVQEAVAAVPTGEPRAAKLREHLQLAWAA